MVGLADDVLTTEPWTREGQDARRLFRIAIRQMEMRADVIRYSSPRLTMAWRNSKKRVRICFEIEDVGQTYGARAPNPVTMDRRSITLRCIRSDAALKKSRRRVGATGFALKAVPPAARIPRSESKFRAYPVPGRPKESCRDH
jgi:hypothetical protein